MAGEVYRAVFIRIHPTGKMVLSLTTEADGHEAEYQQILADRLGVATLDVKVVNGDTDSFGVGHGFNTAPSPGTAPAIDSAAEKILDKARLLAGAQLSAAPESLGWDDGAFATTGEEPQAVTIADVAMYSLSSDELPPGIEGGLDAQTVYKD